MSNWFSQSNRALHLQTPLGDDYLILSEFTGKEALSNLFQFSLNMTSQDTDIAPEKLINKPVTITLMPDGADAPRYFNGIVLGFHAGEIRDGVRNYYAEVAPWLASLHFHSDCRIYQQQNVKDILKTIFSEMGFSDYSFKLLKKTYNQRRYCVQYRETTLSFIQRLLAEEGIFYYFQHTKDKHTLILADQPDGYYTCNEQPATYRPDTSYPGASITTWSRSHTFYSGQVSQTDYDFTKPDTNLFTQQQQPKLTASKRFAQFIYPGGYQELSQGKQLNQTRFEAHESRYEIFHGNSTYPTFSSGGKFTLAAESNTTQDGDYALIALHHYAIDKTHESDSSASWHYYNTFDCISSKVAFRPLYNGDKPLIFGSQTARVVGPAGEEIYTDQYGRIKIQFHWDKHGSNDDKSSCWVRVAQTMAGKNWGSLYIPRIGQEVIVQFLEGDPDQPIVIGTVYNADNMPPYILPDQQTRSGIKTCSTKSGNASMSNELRFEDKSGNEEVYLHAQKDFNRTIENNETVLILKGNHHFTVQQGESMIEASKSITLKAGNSTLQILPDQITLNSDLVKINE